MVSCNGSHDVAKGAPREIREQVPCGHRCECQRHDCGLGPYMDPGGFNGDFHWRIIEVNQEKGADPCWQMNWIWNRCWFDAGRSLLHFRHIWIWISWFHWPWTGRLDTINPRHLAVWSADVSRCQQTQGDRLSHPLHLCILTQWQMASRVPWGWAWRIMSIAIN